MTGDSQRAIRERYLKKVRATEYEFKVKEGIIPEDSMSEFYYDPDIDDMGIDYSSGYEDYGGSNTSSSKVHIQSIGVEHIYVEGGKSAVNVQGQYNYISINTGAGDFYYSYNLSDEAIAAYKGQKMPTSDIVVVSTLNYFKNDKIELPAESSRHIHAASMMKYIQTIGGIENDSRVFHMISPDDFDFGTEQAAEELAAQSGLWARKDFIVYLRQLQRRVQDKLPGKLTINSLYRNPQWDYDHRAQYGWAPWNGHLAGLGADISATGINRVIIADEAYKMGFGGIAIAKNFVHVDILGSARWKYDGAAKYVGPGNPGDSAYK